MPAKAPPLAKIVAAKLAAIGARLRVQRKALRVSATTAAQAAGMSRMTLQRIERGEPSVTMGAYMSAMAAIGLELDLLDADATKTSRRKQLLPKRIRLADFAQLKKIAWQLGEVSSLTPKEALGLYGRNWRHVDKTALSEAERALVRHLTEALGGEPLV